MDQRCPRDIFCNDTLGGGAGTDVFRGNGGSDRFLFDTDLGSTNIDTISDFASDDTIVLDRSIFGGLYLGALTSGQFATLSGTPSLSSTQLYVQ